MAEGSKHRRWLRDQLPTLVERQVLDEASAQRLRAHYALGELGQPRSLALLIFGALGALLVGGGLILIVAHNWDELGRGARATISMGLLLASQALAGYALWRRRESAAWCEGSALLMTLCVGASISLISQTYNIQGELGDFMLTWLALVLPAVYLLRARLTAAACLLLALALPSSRAGLIDFGFSYLLVVAALLPHLVQITRGQAGQARTLLVQWVAALSLPIGLSILLFDGAAGDGEDLALPLLSALFAASHVLGARKLEREHGWLSFRSPLSTVGLLGSVVMAIIMTFDDPWPWSTTGAMSRALGELEVHVTLVCVLLLSALPLRELSRALAERRFDVAALCAVPVLALVGLPLHASAGELPVMVLGNAFALALGLAIMLAGLSARSLRRTNVGLAVLGVLFVVRFVDAELSMVTRGVAMVLVGIAFVTVNVWLVRAGRNAPTAEGQS